MSLFTELVFKYRRPRIAVTLTDEPVIKAPTYEIGTEVLLKKYGTYAISPPLEYEELQEFITHLSENGYDLDKVWPSHGTTSIAYLTFNPDR